MHKLIHRGYIYQNPDKYSKSTVKEVSYICLLHFKVGIKISAFKTYQGQGLQTSLFPWHVHGMCLGTRVFVFPVVSIKLGFSLQAPIKLQNSYYKKSLTVFPSWPQLPQKVNNHC